MPKKKGRRSVKVLAPLFNSSILAELDQQQETVKENINRYFQSMQGKELTKNPNSDDNGMRTAKSNVGTSDEDSVKSNTVAQDISDGAEMESTNLQTNCESGLTDINANIIIPVNQTSQQINFDISNGNGEKLSSTNLNDNEAEKIDETRNSSAEKMVNNSPEKMDLQQNIEISETGHKERQRKSMRKRRLFSNELVEPELDATGSSKRRKTMFKQTKTKETLTGMGNRQQRRKTVQPKIKAPASLTTSGKKAGTKRMENAEKSSANVESGNNTVFVSNNVVNGDTLGTERDRTSTVEKSGVMADSNGHNVINNQHSSTGVSLQNNSENVAPTKSTQKKKSTTKKTTKVDPKLKKKALGANREVLHDNSGDGVSGSDDDMSFTIGARDHSQHWKTLHQVTSLLKEPIMFSGIIRHHYIRHKVEDGVNDAVVGKVVSKYNKLLLKHHHSNGLSDREKVKIVGNLDRIQRGSNGSCNLDFWEAATQDLKFTPPQEPPSHLMLSKVQYKRYIELVSRITDKQKKREVSILKLNRLITLANELDHLKKLDLKFNDKDPINRKEHFAKIRSAADDAKVILNLISC
uniref:GATA zinc finger domain-containing protein 14 n=1 Tax=Ciona intestinalis TaxID=7719 RepID=UPI000180C925|nr:GATA zinc finger domain-containing protein 14 [Ciona intestinalis]|eukprot:XP_002119200.1 GATA zinc finger domain-containing protein 14 [Ciona intestinalis]